MLWRECILTRIVLQRVRAVTQNKYERARCSLSVRCRRLPGHSRVLEHARTHARTHACTPVGVVNEDQQQQPQQGSNSGSNGRSFRSLTLRLWSFEAVWMSSESFEMK